MKLTNNKVTTARGSFLQFFRMMFVLFFLYLLRDALYVWDGFKYYASLSDFVPTVALVSILWTITAFVSTIAAWSLMRMCIMVFNRMGIRIRTDHILFFLAAGIPIGFAAWKVKKIIWPFVQTGILLKLVVFLCVVLTSAYLVWLIRNRTECWYDMIHKRITPLVWLFAFILSLSVPVVGYSIFVKESHKPIPQKITQTNTPVSVKKRPNILLVSFDALTARDMSLYGYERETTPFISKWAKNASLFTKAEASSNHTSPANASMMTGKRVWTHQVFQQGGFAVMGDIESLPGELKKNGYYNLAFVVNPWASATKIGILESFDISPLSIDFNRTDNIVTFEGDLPGLIDNLLYRVFGDKIKKYSWIMENRLLGVLRPLTAPYSRVMNPELSRTAFPPENAFNKFLEIYDKLPEPFFAWIHVYPPHAYCLPPEPYRGLFGPRFPPERFYGDILDNQPHNLRDNRILYDEFIRYSDKQFGEFIASLERKDEQKNTIIILTSDHGESFQHGVYGHGYQDLYEQHTHIPLIIKQQNQESGKVIENLVEQIDIPATVLELADIPVPEWMEGRSLVSLMRGETLSERPAYSMFLRLNRSRGYPITNGTFVAWEGEYKMIYFLKEEKVLLFNLKQDPEETDNLIDREPETGNRLLELIKTNLEKANERIIATQSG